MARGATIPVVSLARDERAALCALLDEAGPDAPTLCDGWETRDLAAHLVLRERRPDAALGAVMRPLAGYTARVQRGIAARPYREVVDLIRHGPPGLSIWAIPGADDKGTALEYFVHHEDVRRAAPGAGPRKLGSTAEDMLWRRLRLAARLFLRSAPGGVILQRDHAGQPAAAAGADRITARSGTPAVTVTGRPSELLLWATGRTTAAQVRLDGDEDAVRRLRDARWTF